MSVTKHHPVFNNDPWRPAGENDRRPRPSPAACWLNRRHGLPLHLATTIAELAGLGGIDER
jgi:hypothetical protein